MLARLLLDSPDREGDHGSVRWPQSVAHRGYNKIWAENSIEALRSALTTDEIRQYARTIQSPSGDGKGGEEAAKRELAGNAIEALARTSDTSTSSSSSGAGAKDSLPADQHEAADGIEFDVHLTRDKVVVISHDPSLKRCFGVDKLISDSDWHGGIDTLKSLREPHTRMPLFTDVLSLLRDLADRGVRKWCMVDVKLGNDLGLMQHLAADLKATSPDGSIDYWRDKLVLGLWHHKFLDPASQHMPKIPISHIGLDLSYARARWLDDDRVVGFNMQIYALLSPWAARDDSKHGGDVGDAFVKECHNRGKAVSVWTVNSPPLVRYAQSLGCDVVMTDDPLLMEASRRRAVRQLEEGGQEELHWDRAQFWPTWKVKAKVAALQWMLWGICLYRIHWKYS